MHFHVFKAKKQRYTTPNFVGDSRSTQSLQNPQRPEQTKPDSTVSPVSNSQDAKPTGQTDTIAICLAASL